MYRQSAAALLLCATLHASAFAAPPELDAAVMDLAHGWAKISYHTPDSDKEAAFRNLIAKSRQVSHTFPARAEPLIWQAIVLASAAKTEGGLSALSKAKEARDLLLEAEKISPGALNGSAYDSLGTLYAKVPGWPIGFGDKKKAREYLVKALALDPNGIDANFFYGEFLADQGEYAKAFDALTRALNAPARAGREDADAGRREEVSQLLASLREKHGAQAPNR
jgi:tetratricopeptide (TPR) repeat protein